MTAPGRPLIHSDAIRLRLPRQLREAIDQAASARGQAASEWLRQAARVVCSLEGVDIPVADVRRLPGDPEWALVAPGDPDRILTWRHHPTRPDVSDASYWPKGRDPGDGAVWVPLVVADSEPFDPAQHWRERPIYEVVSVYDRPDHVRRVYPVVPKGDA